jgi:hypothetical protein
MCDEKNIDNKLSKNKKPTSADSKAAKCLEPLLKGIRINRLTLDELGISEKNDSAHAMISTLRNERHIPVVSDRSEGKTCNYFMTPREIKRYNDPILRQQQQEEMRFHVKEKRTHRTLKSFLKSLMSWRKSSELRQHVESSPVTIRKISHEVNALIDQKKD